MERKRRVVSTRRNSRTAPTIVNPDGETARRVGSERPRVTRHKGTRTSPPITTGAPVARSARRTHRLTPSPLHELHVLERQAAHRLAGRGEDRIHHRRRHPQIVGSPTPPQRDESWLIGNRRSISALLPISGGKPDMLGWTSRAITRHSFRVWILKESSSVSLIHANVR
jgi:hypothetical protein